MRRSDFCGVADESTVDSVSRIIDAVLQTNSHDDGLIFGSDPVQQFSPSSFEDWTGVGTASSSTSSPFPSPPAAAAQQPIDGVVTATGAIKGQVGLGRVTLG